MGRLSARKGVTLLVDAFADVARTRTDARLLIAGPDEGMESTTRAAVRDLGISDRVVFAGALSGDDRLAALAAADLFALPAIGEGFSVAVLEALACGVPAILSPECQFPALAEAGAGIVVTRQRAQWAGAMSALLADPARLDGMSGRARALVERQYTWRRIAGEVEAAYRAAIDRRRVEPR
jgi:glycosyltransferase involved in cell wall biosynthesis